MATPVKRVNGASVEDHPESDIGSEHVRHGSNRSSPNPWKRSQDVIMHMKESLFQHGKARAIERGDLEKQPGVVESLTAHAEAMAREIHTEEFDGSKIEHDRLLKEEHEENRRKRPEAEHAEKFAEAAVRDAEEELARLQSNQEEPVAPRWLMIAGVIVLAITIAPTLHDFIFITMDDDMFNWFVSLVSASFVGLLITAGILGDIDSTGRRTAANWGGLIGGIVIGVGLGVLRVAHAADLNEFVFAAALTIVECGIILMMEWRAAALRAAYREWAGSQEKITLAEAHLDACRSQLARCQERVQKINDDIYAYIGYVQDRWVRHNNINGIVAAAIKSILDGYDSGIAFNVGYIEGSPRRVS